MMTLQTLSSESLLSLSPVLPVLVIHDLKNALPLAEALSHAGIKIIEITLRTPVALEAIHLIRQEMPHLIVGAGTITHASQFQQILEVDAQFAISPGITLSLLKATQDLPIPFIPGIGSISDLMLGMEFQFTHFKLYPAEALGGITMLKAIYGPFPQIKFCPTGGIHEENFLNYLKLPNVSCVGGSWIVPQEAILKNHWQTITALALNALTYSQHT